MDLKLEISQNDDRKYKYIKLSNDLEVLLIHDPSTEKSSACCDVHIGSMADPNEAQGLAHFLEHMLFLGTETYPVENAYSSFLSSHGGDSNAYTDQEDTVYYFSVQSEYLEEALNMFASFFTCPLFSESAVLRELNAVDSENSKNLQSDLWRQHQLLKSQAISSHPFSSFSTGNLETLQKAPEVLNLNIRDIVIKFYQSHYSSNRMKVVIYGKEPLDILQSWAETKFSAIPNKHLPRFHTSPIVFTPDQLGKTLEIVPVKDVKEIDIYFPMPPVQNLYLSKPNRYISHLVGHESGGSILAALKDRGLANNLMATTGDSLTDFSIFRVKVELTDEGLQQVDDVVACIYAYFGMLNRIGPQMWIQKENQDIMAMAFRFEEKLDPSDTSTHLASNMQIYPPQHIITGDKLIYDTDISMVKEFMKCLRPEYSLLFIQHKGFQGKTTNIEKHYKTAFNKHPFTESQLSLWQKSYDGNHPLWTTKNIHLPEPNPFIPLDFTIRNITSDPSLSSAEQEKLLLITPILIKKDANSTDLTWFKPDFFWKVPKVNVVLSLESSLTACSALSMALTEVLADCLKDLLSEYSYYADCAELHYDVNLSKGGLHLTFNGFQHKLPLLVEKTLKELKIMSTGYTKCSEDVFDRIKERVLRKFHNEAFKQPYYHCLMGTLSCLEDPRWTIKERHEALIDATRDDFNSFVRQFLYRLKVEMLVHGNMTSEEIKSFTDMVYSVLNCQTLSISQIAHKRVIKLQSGIEYIYNQHARDLNPEEVNSAVENIYCIGFNDVASPFNLLRDDHLNSSLSEVSIAIKNEALLEITAHLLREPAFDQLRTKEQLGYIVFTSIKKISNYLGLHMIVQSGHKGPKYLNWRIESFLKQYRAERLVPMTLEEFNTNIQAVIETILEKPKNLDEEAMRYWNEIKNSSYLFNRKLDIVKTLKNLSLVDVIQFFDEFIYDSQTRRKFSSRFLGNNPTTEDTTNEESERKEDKDKYLSIDNYAIFKRSMPLEPVHICNV